MKPEQFIREYGVKRAREVVEGRSKAYMPELFKYWSEQLNDYVLAPKYASFLVDDLKRLVESLDIIDDLEGIKGAKGTLYDLVQLGWDEFEHRYIDNWMCTRQRLESAIRDHESIYGGGGE